MIKIPRFDSGATVEWIILVQLVQKALVGQNINTGPPMSKYMENLLKGDVKGEFVQQASLVGTCTVDNFTTVM